MKRIFDVFFCLIALFFLSPLLVSLFIYIKVVYSNVFFIQKRIGKDGILFNCLKFRTMVINAEEILEKLLEENPEIKKEYFRDFKLKKDPRVLGVIGKILRKTSLDEIPQIYNIIRGEMSIVGPRPIIEDEIQKYGERFKEFSSVKPGLTGLWQVSGRNDISYEDRVALDIYYVRNNNLFMDISIIVKTLEVVIIPTGAY